MTQDTAIWLGPRGRVSCSGSEGEKQKLPYSFYVSRSTNLTVSNGYVIENGPIFSDS